MDPNLENAVASNSQGLDRMTQGRVSAVRGTVIDIQFEDALPSLFALLRCDLSLNRWITAVVQGHLDRSTVRAIAIESTRGCAAAAGSGGTAVRSVSRRDRHSSDASSTCKAAPSTAVGQREVRP
jgi:hypothetical protein